MKIFGKRLFAKKIITKSNVEEQKNFHEIMRRLDPEDKFREDEDYKKNPIDEGSTAKISISDRIQKIDFLIKTDAFSDITEKNEAVFYRQRLEFLKNQEKAIYKAKIDFEKRYFQDKVGYLFELSKEMAKLSKEGNFVARPPKRIKLKCNENGHHFLDYNPFAEQRDESLEGDDAEELSPEERQANLENEKTEQEIQEVFDSMQ